VQKDREEVPRKQEQQQQEEEEEEEATNNTYLLTCWCFGDSLLKETRE
jgi:hypothetical protein